MKTPLALAAVSALLLATPALAGAQCGARSGATPGALLELYTSEGCSSCPPADAWLARVDARRVVPLAFHVDYWDYIGWRDPWGSAAHSRRQREAAQKRGKGFVYTPQFAFNGAELRPAGDEALEKALREQARPAGARLSIEASPDGAGLAVRVSAELAGSAPASGARVWLALAENGLESRVSAGENSGRTLRHSHVVRSLLGPFAFAADGRLELRQSVGLPAGARAGRLSLVGFVEDAASGRVLEALSTGPCL